MQSRVDPAEDSGMADVNEEAPAGAEEGEIVGEGLLPPSASD